MFTVNAAERIRYVNIDVLTQPDSFLRFSWIISVLGFMLFFSYSLFKYRKMKPVIQYSVSLVAAFAIFFGVYATVSYYSQQNRSVEAEDSFMPHALSVNQSSSDSVTLRWYTVKPTIQTVRYHYSGGPDLTVNEDQENSELGATPKYNHVVTINDLRQGEVYMFSIIDGDTIFNRYQDMPIQIILN